MANTMTTSANISAPDQAAPHALQVEHIEELLKLHKAAQKINSILDLDQLVDKIVNDVATSFGYLEASIYLHDEERGEMVLVGVHGCTLDCAGHRLRIGKEGMVGYAASTGQIRYAPDVRLDPYYVACDESTLSELAIPLHVDGQLVGVFMASHHELDAFSSDQRRLLQALCHHVAVALHNARRFQVERKEKEVLSRDASEAATIQQALFPKSSPYVPGFAISGHSIPAGSVGGDWYDFIPLSEGRWGLVLADVAGKGTAAALLMSATRGMLRSLAQTGSGPAEVLTRLNNMMIEDFPDGRFVTMVYAELDPSSRVLRIANAGHLSPLLVDLNEPSGHRWINHEHGLPLGISASKFSETEVTLGEHSRVAFYTDGITEAEIASGEEYGAERLLAQMQSPDVTVDGLLADVRKFANGAGLRDDATVILVSTR